MKSPSPCLLRRPSVPPFVRALPVTGASISVFGVRGYQSTICATDSTAARAEALQSELGEGPHWEALRIGAPVLCPDLTANEQQEWPVFRLAARDLGVAAMFSFPMRMGAVVVGVVEAFSRLRAHAFAAGRPVEGVAHDVVGGRVDFSTSPD